MSGAPYEVANPYSEADLFDIHYVQSADVLTLVHPGHAPRELRRLGPTSWSLVTIPFGSQLAAPTGLVITTDGVTTPGTPTAMSSLPSAPTAFRSRRLPHSAA